MRVAVVADIHGNLPALEAVIADLRAQSPDLVVNLGDHLSGPLWSAATADLLMTQSAWVHIRGNHDRYMSALPLEAQGPSARAASEQLSGRHTDWLRNLPLTATVDGDILLCHGTPQCDEEYLVEDVSSGFARMAPPEDIRERATVPGLERAPAVILCGHSHLPQLIRLDGTSIIANPGSIGLPAYEDREHHFPHVIECGSPHARYLILDRRGRNWNATFRAIEYDWESAAGLAGDSGRPDWSYSLRTGYAPR